MVPRFVKKSRTASGAVAVQVVSKDGAVVVGVEHLGSALFQDWHGDHFTDGQILESAQVMDTGTAARERRIVYQYSFKRY